MALLVKELMIGDWVNITGRFILVHEDSVATSCTITDFETRAAKINGLINNRLYANALINEAVTFKPIPLTIEILEKNGFIYESDGLTWYDGIHDKEHLYVYCPIRRNGNVRKIEICSTRCHYFVELEKEYYVHELQHILRLCGLNELADNFKI